MPHLYQSFLRTTFLLTVFACGQRQYDEFKINELIVSFPQLQINTINQSSSYKLIRTVSFGQPTITIKLYSQPDSIDDKQKIILITNSKLNSYAIPFFSNTYTDYWNFQFDNQNQNTKPINTTFENQLNICLDTLHLIDTIGTGGKVISEILYSLLHCREINLSDSSDFEIIEITGTSKSPEENSDSCRKRLKQNWNAISQELYPNNSIIYKNSCWDKDDGRIYQFDYRNLKRKQKNYFKLKVFRQDCNWNLLTL